MANRIQLRRDTSANWATINPILADGEPGLEIDTNKIKYGDGTHGWVSLSYSGSSDPTRLVNGSYSVTLTSDGYVLFPNYRFPAADGTSNQVLQTNGSGVVSWGTINTTTDQLVNGSYTVALNSSGLLTVPSIIDSTAGTGAVTINSNDGATTRTWTFGTGGDLTLPQTGSGAASITSGVNGLSITANSHTWEFAPSGSLVVPGAIQSTNGIVISNAGVVGATAGIVLPANAGTGAVQIGNTYGPIQLGSAAGGGTELTWTFDTTGSLTLPGSETISDSDGDLVIANPNLRTGIRLSVTHPGPYTNSWYFNSAGAIVFPDNTQQTTAYPGTKIGNAINIGTTSSNIFIPNTNNQALGLINSLAGVYIEAGNPQKVWQFNTDGTLALPGSLTGDSVSIQGAPVTITITDNSGLVWSGALGTYTRLNGITPPKWAPANYNPSSDSSITYDGGWQLNNPAFGHPVYVNTGGLSNPSASWDPDTQFHLGSGNPAGAYTYNNSVSYTHLTLPTKRIV